MRNPGDLSQDEHERLTALHALGLLDTPREAIYDRLVRLVVRHFAVEFPKGGTGGGIVGAHVAPGGCHVDHTIDYQRRAFLSTRNIEVDKPAETELADIVT